MHQMGWMDGDQSSDTDDSEDDDGGEIRLCSFRGCISNANTDEGLCDRHSTLHDNNSSNEGEKNLANPGKHKRQPISFVFDLSDVPPKPPIPKSEGHVKEGASKYTGVSFNKQTNKWQAKIMIKGKQHQIGHYESEEEAAVDYARAVYKYKGEKMQQKSLVINLSDVPSQPPIPKHAGRIKEGASKYTGVSFDKQRNKWKAQITIEGKHQLIGYYDEEDAAAIDYARALVKYKGKGVLDKAREQNSPIIDLSDVPPQHPVPKHAGRIKEGASKYTGVTFDKLMNKWQARISIEGKHLCIGYYDEEDAAAIDYARALVKYKGKGALDKAREQNSPIIDLSDVPSQPPIPKSAGRIKEGASKYAGVTFDKQRNKWKAQITIEGKHQCIGYYDEEDAAAIDYARALVKYKDKGALEKAREQKTSIIDLGDVPSQPPIPKSAGRIKEGASKYAGVYRYVDNQTKKWKTQIDIDGKTHHIGFYTSEEEAAVDYARAVFKYGGKRRRSKDVVDLSGIPPQPPIPKSGGRKDGASKYAGITFRKKSNKWQARIRIGGKKRTIGDYDDEEEAAADYARAVFKYKEKNAAKVTRDRRKKWKQDSYQRV
jgi:hypothetical protein